VYRRKQHVYHLLLLPTILHNFGEVEDLVSIGLPKLREAGVHDHVRLKRRQPLGGAVIHDVLLNTTEPSFKLRFEVLKTQHSAHGVYLRPSLCEFCPHCNCELIGELTDGTVDDERTSLVVLGGIGCAARVVRFV
jgi:hypothetical protein